MAEFKKDQSSSFDHLIYLSFTYLCKKHSDIFLYLKSLCNIIQFVHNRCENDNKMFYIRLLREQISEHEISVLFYYVLSKFCGEYFKSLTEKYSFFILLAKENLLDEKHAQLLQSSAYNEDL